MAPATMLPVSDANVPADGMIRSSDSSSRSGPSDATTLETFALAGRQQQRHGLEIEGTPDRRRDEGEHLVKWLVRDKLFGQHEDPPRVRLVPRRVRSQLLQARPDLPTIRTTATYTTSASQFWSLPTVNVQYGGMKNRSKTRKPSGTATKPTRVPPTTTATTTGTTRTRLAVATLR